MHERWLYRGKRIDNGEWAYGVPFQITKGAWLDPIVNGTYIQESQKLKNGEIILTGVQEVDPETIGQYTGLKDKNGVKIFAGDLVTAVAYSYTECEDEYSGEIYYGELGLCLLDALENGSYESKELSDLEGSYITVYEVYGNIHDKEEKQNE